MLVRDALPPMLIHGYLPGCEYVNAHAVEISAPAEEVWAALPDLRSRAKDNRFFSILLKIASLLRRDRVESLTRVGRIEMREGAVLVGGDPPMFKVERVSEPAEVVIGGKHRFATYFLNFFVETAGTKSRLYNVTRAEFSHSALGRFYFAGVRMFHNMLVESLLNSVKERVEAKSPIS